MHTALKYPWLSNPEAAHLYKHAMHLLRLLITGTDILNGKGVITRRLDEHDFLMNVRNGVYSFDQIFKYTDECQERFEQAAKSTNLPYFPYMEKIEELLLSLY
jgi:hypothetical protein